MSKIRSALLWLDGRPDLGFLLVDAGIALFILLAHGGALAITRLGKAPMFEPYVPVLMASVSVAFLVFVSAVVSLPLRHLRTAALKFHAVVLSIFSACSLALAAYWVMAGFPSIGFSWTPGLLTVLCVYPAYLLSRTFSSQSPADRKPLADLSIWVGCVAFALDIGMGVRFALKFSQFFSGRL